MNSHAAGMPEDRPTMDTGIGRSAPLWNRGFLSLLATQFVEAATDNVVKTLLTIAVAVGRPWESVLGTGGGGWIGVAFTLPFIVLSAWAGRVADRNSKRSLTVVLKAASFVVVVLAALGFGLGNAWLAFAALIAFAVISAFFGPAKYGMIAELVARREIARANGVINMATNVAVIVGVLLAGFLADHWEHSLLNGALRANETAVVTSSGASALDVWGAWLPGMVLAVLATVGLLTCLTLPLLTAQDPFLKHVGNPLTTYVQTIKEMSAGPLLPVALAWTFFYFVAAVALLVLPDYASILKVSNSEVSYLLGGLGISIGIGCVVAAWLDRPARRRVFVPAGALGLCAGFLTLGLLPPTYFNVATLISATGFVAGFYIIPLQSLLQMLSPDESRGRCLGTANGMSFMMGAVGSLMFVGLRHFGMESNRIFAVLGSLCACAAVWTWWRLRRTDLTGRRSE